MSLKRLLAAAPCAAVIAAAAAVPASAGEYNAHGDRTGSATKANSVCSTSGLNLDDPGLPKTQNFGEFAREGGGPFFFTPGQACRPPWGGVEDPSDLPDE